jgi:SAM-dependent methyltransferase
VDETMSGSRDSWIILATGIVVAACLAMTGCRSVPGVEVPYVPTPPEVVTAMLQLARVGPDDVVYDLGSGDGRVVITAAKDFGARGMGVELQPDLVKQSNDLARKAGVSDRVRFVQQDLFLLDLKPATVVTLYLSTDLNERLRPRLQSQLRPGSRVVSHDFEIRDWPSERMITVQSRDRLHRLYLWTVVRGEPKASRAYMEMQWKQP